VSSHAAPLEPRAIARRIAVPRVSAATLTTVAFTALLAAVALEGQGGLQLGPLTTVEIVLELLAGVAAAAALLIGPSDTRPHGLLALGLFGVLLAYTAASIGWAINPDDAWVEANRTLAWFSAFALGFALVRTWPERYGSLLGGFVAAAVIVCGYAVLTKVFPSTLNPDELVARLREPFGYWNSVGLMSAMAGPACLWLGSRRTGHAVVNALAYPAFGLLTVALLLAYSRGSLLVLLIGSALWFVFVPLRLRGVAVLAAGGFGGVFVGLWSFSQDALSRDQIPLAQRDAAGHDLGILVVAMLIVLFVVGLAVGFSLAERAPSRTARRQVGALVLVCVALVPVGVAGMLATSQKGFTGTISSGWRNLTDPNARQPPNDPTRLAAAGSVRARYWDEALKIWRTDEAIGVGAGGYRTARPRIRKDQINVRHAHGYVVQTLADLGLVGLLINLGLLAAWIVAAVHATALWGRDRRAHYTPERIALMTMITIVVVFGAHSTIDWTWIVPGNAVPAVLFAGWVAGRGSVVEPLGVRSSARSRLDAGIRSPWRVGGAVAALAVAGLAAWTTYQPQRSVNAVNDALDAADANNLPLARADVRRARVADPLAIGPLYAGATIETIAGNDKGARALYEEAVRKEPSSSESWLRLAQFELDRGDPQAALHAVGPALYLDPRSVTVQLLWLNASRAETQRRADAAQRAKTKADAKKGKKKTK
jgi:hypothetical protein